jgi:hypothetical protein
MRYRDLYRMCEGKMSYMELSEVIPQLKHLEKFIDDSLKDAEHYTWLKHYDILGVVINAIVGWYTRYEETWNVTSCDEQEVNAYERTATELMTSYIREQFDKELNLRLVQAGINPFQEDFASEEERQQYMEAIASQKEAMTPPEIQEYLSCSFRTAAVEWGNHTVKADCERFRMAEMDAENLRDKLLTGVCFRNHHIGYDYYRPEVWSPRNTFYSKSLDIKYVENGDYVGRVHFWTKNEFVTRYAHVLTEKQIRGILGGAKSYHPSGGKHPDAGSVWEEAAVPFAQYDDHRLMYGIQEYSGVPMGEYHSAEKDGSETVRPQFLPNPDRFGAYGYHRASMLREDIDVRSDLIQTTEAYWVSWRKVYYITWQQEDGMVVEDIVTDELIDGFLKERGIERKNLSLSEYEGSPEVNTYIVAWIPEVRYGVKACTGVTDLHEDVYLYGDPIDVQVKGDSNVFDFKLPVSGVTGHSLAEKLYPYQVGYNLCMNQMYNLLEKEIGIFFLFDINFIPSEFKKGGTMEQFMLNLMEVAKSIGLLGTDMSKTNMAQQGGGNFFNQFQRVDLSNGTLIASRIQTAEYLYGKALSLVGLTPQVLGTPVDYQTSTGVKEGLNSSLVQLQPYFDEFDGFKKRDWDIHLSIAQYCQKEGKDITVMYTRSDLSRAYLHFSDPMLPLRTFNILATTSSKRRRELESLKQLLLQNDTMGADELELAKIWTSDSMNELIDIARSSREYREGMKQRDYDHQLEVQQRQIQFENQIDAREHQQKLQIEHVRGQYKLGVEKVQAMGRAADKNANGVWVDYINEAADRELRTSEQEENRALKEQEIAAKALSEDKDREIQLQELAQRAEELRLKREKMQSDERIAAMNKN